MRRNSSSSSPGPRQPDASRDFLAGFRELDRVLHNLRHDRADLLARANRNSTDTEVSSLRSRENAINFALSGIESMTEPAAQETEQDSRFEVYSRNNAYPGWSRVRLMRNPRDYADRSLWESLAESNAEPARQSPYIEGRMRKIIDKKYPPMMIVSCSYLSSGVSFTGKYVNTPELSCDGPDRRTELSLFIESVDIDANQVYASARFADDPERVLFVEGKIANFTRSSFFSSRQMKSALSETIRWHRIKPFAATNMDHFFENLLDDTTVRMWMENFIFLRFYIEKPEGGSTPFLASIDRSTGAVMATLEDDEATQKFTLSPDKYMSQDVFSWR